MRLLVVIATILATPAWAGDRAALADLAWMVGRWQVAGDTVTLRETWLAPLGGVMAGVNQTHRQGRPPAIEFMTLAVEPAGLTFTARLEGQPPTPFVLRPGGTGEAVFENLAHDFPQRVIYGPCGEDLCARIEGTVDGESRGIDWRYKRLP